jgi:hypothetical protein
MAIKKRETRRHLDCVLRLRQGSVNAVSRMLTGDWLT